MVTEWTESSQRRVDEDGIQWWWDNNKWVLKACMMRDDVINIGASQTKLEKVQD